jgi:NAD(P)-dependent dehydrogenase (short-subunit alcohol dehydrogenase family)
VVTGAANGIGLAVAQRLRERGLRVAAVDVDETTLSAAPLPADTLRIVADVADDPREWVDRVAEGLQHDDGAGGASAGVDGVGGLIDDPT